MSTREEVAQLVIEYNEAEAQQQARLESLYKLMRDMGGSTRFVDFSDGTRWTVNAFQPLPEALSLPRFVGELSRFITSCEPGEARDG